MAKLTKEKLGAMGRKIMSDAKKIRILSGSKTKQVKVYNLDWKIAVGKAAKGYKKKPKQLKLKFKK